MVYNCLDHDIRDHFCGSKNGMCWFVRTGATQGRERGSFLKHHSVWVPSSTLRKMFDVFVTGENRFV